VIDDTKKVALLKKRPWSFLLVRPRETPDRTHAEPLRRASSLLISREITVIFRRRAAEHKSFTPKPAPPESWSPSVPRMRWSSGGTTLRGAGNCRDGKRCRVSVFRRSLHYKFAKLNDCTRARSKYVNWYSNGVASKEKTSKFVQKVVVS
jgi:hypothetical protein